MSHDVSLSFDWAHKAYDAYCAGLPLEVREQLRKPAGEAFVVLYGPTQVGKTTLILTMLQLSEDGHARVGQALRGKRQKGESSTAVATQYRRSKDENWSLSWKDRHIIASSDEEMANELEQLRRSMMDGAIAASDDYCTINIPLSYFKPQEGNGMQKTIRILDLPGIEADNVQEKEYVRAISRKFVPVATLTLLVSKADDLGFFFKGLEGVPEIKNWTNTPSRFRVVTTYSFTPETVRKTVEKKKGNIKAYQQELIAQIGTFGTLPERAQKEDLYYPLEFGTSWQESSLRKDTPTLDEMIQQEFKRLYDDIAQADDPLNYLLSVLDSQGCAEAFYKERSEVLNDEINIVSKKIEHSRKIIESFNEKIKDVKNLVRRGEIELDALQFLSKDGGPISLFLAEYKKRQEFDQKMMSDLLQKNQWPVSDLKNFTTLFTIGGRENKPEDELALLRWTMCDYNAWLLREQEFWEFTRENNDVIFHKACLHFFNTLPSAEELLGGAHSFILSNFQMLMKKLDGYWIDSYWSDDSYQQDCSLFISAYRVSAARIEEIIFQALDIGQKRFKEKIRKRKDQAEGEVRVLEIQIAKRVLELVLLEQQISESFAQKKQIDAEWLETKEKTDDMHSFFLNEYFKAVSNAYEMVYTANGAGSSLLSLCYAENLKHSRNVVEEKIFHQ